MAINRKSPEYKMWRAKIYASDKWECRICKSKVRLEAHHLMPVRKYPELALDENNGITLCFTCHRTIFGKEEQVAKALAGLKANGVNSVETYNVSERIVDNTEPTLGGNTEKGVTTRNRVFRIEQFEKVECSCTVCGKKLVRHYYRATRSQVFLCSKECRQTWMVGKFAGIKNPMYKPLPTQTCQSCKTIMSPTASNPHRKKKFCSNSCHTKYMWSTGKTAVTILNGRWTKKYSSCIKCHSKESRHYGKGMCMKCYNKNYNSRIKDSNIPTKTPLERDDIV